MALRRLAAVLTLALTGLAVFVLGTRDQREQPERQQLTSASQPQPSTADVHYAQMMIVHHEQAVRMSRTLMAKGGAPERIHLIADFIAHDQQREIDQTAAWLSAWERPPAAPALSGAGHGMLTEAQLADLDAAPPAEASPLYLRLMIEHHEGAVTMSRTLLDAPRGNAFIHGLARHVINEQTAEIDAMRALLRA